MNAPEGKLEQPVAPLEGLTTAEAAARLAEYGPNAVAVEHPHALRALVGKFWAPVPWLLEVSVLLQLLLGRYAEAVVVAVLLVFNAVLSFFQESRAQNALALLRQHLTIQARVLRDGRWQLLPAQELAPADIVHVRMGDLAPADLRIASGQVLLDQSALTGESTPVEAGVGQTAYAGTIVNRGEATGEVTATGARTAFGKTAELIRLAHAGSHLETIIFAIVKYLVILDALVIAAVLVYGFLVGMALGEILPFALILLLASIPVALPATFTVATALGAMELARHGVLVTRLSAIEEAAAMDVLCSDKTGTITKNQLAVAAVLAFPPHRESDALRLGALACDEASQDPLDLAILAAAHDRAAPVAGAQRLRFIPFDPATKRSEAFFQEGETTLHVAKGAPRAIGSLLGEGFENLDPEVDNLAEQGLRVLAVAAGTDAAMKLVGLIGLQDPPREDSHMLVQDLRSLGVRVLMVTGDGETTAKAVAHQVGIGERVGTPGVLRTGGPIEALEYDIFAGVLPEDKFRLVHALQQAGHAVGMTGDGVNDAPALKQAEVGIAVANATDVAKSAASLVLTSPGLGNVVAAVQTSRRIYQRMLTYTLNKIVKTVELALFLSLGLILTRTFVTTPLLVVLLFFTNDFVTMAIATDRVSFARTPERWRTGSLMATSLTLASLILLFSFGVFFVARDWLGLPLPQLQTLIFVMLVFTGQGTVYLVRERRHFWSSRPSAWLLLSSLLDVLVVSVLATRGILMAPISPLLVAGLMGLIAIYLVGLDFLKIQVVKFFHLR